MTNNSTFDPRSETTAVTAPGIEHINGQQIGLFVQSCWQADRFHHTLGLLWQGTRIPVLISCEGDAEEIWPPSPPLQQVHCQQIGNQPALLAVGMAGTSHFSSSFLLTGEERITLMVQLACRLKSDGSNDQSPDLRATYQVDENWERQEFGDASTLRISARHDRQMPPGLPALVFGCDQEGPESTIIETVDEEQIQVRPTETAVDQAVQWKFTLSWDNATTTQ